MTIFFALLAFTFVFASFAAYSSHTATYFMILAFLCTGVEYYLLSATYLSMMLFVVYVGAIAILFVFCVMLLNLSSAETADHGTSFVHFLYVTPAALAFAVYLIGEYRELGPTSLTVNKLTTSVILDWAPFSKDHLLTLGLYTNILPVVVLLGFVLFFVTVLVTVLFGLIRERED
jgi:NADH:ubiquinone oxidoreductase subunit 6 (subunit J)